MKAGAVAPDALLVAQRLCEGLSKRNAAILDRMVGVHFEIALASKRQIHHRMFGKQRQHVVEERNAGFDRRLARAVNV